MQGRISLLKELCKNTFEQSECIISLTPIEASSGSARRYYRIKTSRRSLIGVYHENLEENRNFIHFSKHFFQNGLHVPDILAQDLSNHIYIIQDLGDETLFTRMNTLRQSEDDFPKELMNLYRKTLDELLKIQFLVHRGFDYSLCYPRSAFDRQSMRWDLNYFKYYFLKLAHIPFDEQLLENDFETLIDFLVKASSEHFLYRDFQSRNIMLFNDELFFIDYQGCRKGALQYDVASLLYDGKANIPHPVRLKLLNYYVRKLRAYDPEIAKMFKHYYYGYVFIRIMQAMGSYGYRGFYEQKKHFLQSIPYALQNLGFLLKNVTLPIEIPTLWRVFEQLVDSSVLQSLGRKRLRVAIGSFSYGMGYPTDKSDHGGGFVFDCRCLPNPGRYPQYQYLTGKDAEVEKFLDNEPSVKQYFEYVKQLVDMAIENYLQRDFEYLSVHFGCTGGRHRSVYFARKLQRYIFQTHQADVSLTHQMQKFW